MIGNYISKTNTNNWKIFIFCLIIIQSIGIRFFSGQGTILSIIIIALTYKSFTQLTRKDVWFLSVLFLFLTVSKIINTSFSFSSFLYQISLIISTYLFLVGYRNKTSRLQTDFFIALKIFVFHAVIGYCIYLILPDLFVLSGMNKSFLNLFYVSSSDFGGFQRNTGFFWEPGVYQLVANLYLFYCIKFNKKILNILIAVLAVISSFSTTGLLILLINFSYLLYLKWKSKKLNFINIVLLVFVALTFIPIINKNANEKINNQNTSGLVRLRDYQIGIELINEKPILGHGVFDSEYLKTKDYVKSSESKLFSNEYMEKADDMGGGYTNGLLGLIACYGIPVSFLLYFFYFKNRFMEDDLIERILFCLIPLLSMLSEPISYTSLFLMFPFSYWILNKKKKENIKKQPK